MGKRVILGLLMACCTSLCHATSLQDFQAKSPTAQGEFLSNYVDTLATAAQEKNPQLGRAIVEYFTKAPHEKELPPGIADLMVQVMAVDRLAKEGKADLSKIQIESMILYVVKQHFKA